MLEEDELPLFRAAVAAAESGSIPPIREYIEAGGDLQRQVTDDDAMAVVRTTPRRRRRPRRTVVAPASGSGWGGQRQHQCWRTSHAAPACY